MYHSARLGGRTNGTTCKRPYATRALRLAGGSPDRGPSAGRLPRTRQWHARHRRRLASQEVASIVQIATDALPALVDQGGADRAALARVGCQYRLDKPAHGD